MKLRYLETWTNRRRENAHLYQQVLAGLSQVHAPQDAPHEYAVYHTFVIQVDRRDDLRQHLAARGISTAIHYPTPIHFNHAAHELGYAPGSFSVTERQAERILSLPVYPELTAAQNEEVGEAIRVLLIR